MNLDVIIKCMHSVAMSSITVFSNRFLLYIVNNRKTLELISIYSKIKGTNPKK